jgi:hypothetical protein
MGGFSAHNPGVLADRLASSTRGSGLRITGEEGEPRYKILEAPGIFRIG